MRIGVICEGRTDFPAIKEFFGAALEAEGLNVTLVDIYPQMDNSAPEGSWSNVLLWFDSNPPASRVERYFGGGLFAGNLDTKRLDAILIQIDTDILEEVGFRNYVRNNYAYDVTDVDEPSSRANQISEILRLAWKYDEMTEADNKRHVDAPAVESTETWCLAAFEGRPQGFELLRGQQLTDAFMSALERSESRTPSPPYSSINKDIRRREIFCSRLAEGSDCARRVTDGCEAFRRAVQSIVSLPR